MHRTIIEEVEEARIAILKKDDAIRKSEEKYRRIVETAGEGFVLMSSTRSFLRMRASQPGTVSEIVAAINTQLSQDVLDTGRFMTLFYLTVDPQKDEIHWVRAGHDPAILYDPEEDQFEELGGAGIALGIDAEHTYEENRKGGLKTGQVIAIGTDGIWEAYSKDGQMFGKERFRDLIRRNATEGAADILNAVYDDLGRFTVGRRSEDDITLVILKINRSAEREEGASA